MMKSIWGKDPALAAVNLTVIILLFVSIIYFGGETAEGPAFSYTFRLDFPENSAATRNEQIIFHILKITGYIVGALSLQRVQLIQKPSAKTGILAAVPFGAAMLILITLLWSRMIINLVVPLLSCMESLFFLWMCRKELNR